MKEQNKGAEVVAISIGPKQCSETIRTALAMGADRGIHIETKPDVRGDYIDLQPYAIAGLLKGIVEKEDAVDLVLMGKQSIDSVSMCNMNMTIFSNINVTGLIPHYRWAQTKFLGLWTNRSSSCWSVEFAPSNICG